MIMLALAYLIGWVIGFADDLDNTIDPTARTGFDKVQVSAILVGVVLPLLVGLVTKRWTSSNVKAFMLLGASALTAFITEWANSANFVWQQAFLTMILTFGTGVVAQKGFWQYNLGPKAQDAFAGTPPPPQE